MSTTPSQFAPELENRNAKADGQASAAPPASSSSKAAPPAASSTNTTKTTNTAPASSPPYHKSKRRFRVSERVQKLKKFSTLWGAYIDAKFNDLYVRYLQIYRLPDDEQNRRQKLKAKPGYMEAYKAFRQEKEAFIKRLVSMMNDENKDSVLVIDREATAFMEANQARSDA